MESGYYPIGAEDDSNAPYNREDPVMIDVEIDVNINISKSVIVSVPSDYDKYDLRQEVLKKVKFLENITEEDTALNNDKYTMKDLFNWRLVDIELNEI